MRDVARDLLPHIHRFFSSSFSPSSTPTLHLPIPNPQLSSCPFLFFIISIPIFHQQGYIAKKENRQVPRQLIPHAASVPDRGIRPSLPPPFLLPIHFSLLRSLSHIPSHTHIPTGGIQIQAPRANRQKGSVTDLESQLETRLGKINGRVFHPRSRFRVILPCGIFISHLSYVALYIYRANHVHVSPHHPPSSFFLLSSPSPPSSFIFFLPSLLTLSSHPIPYLLSIHYLPARPRVFLREREQERSSLHRHTTPWCRCNMRA